MAKFGRRPIYVICFTLFFLCVVWAGLAKTYSQGESPSVRQQRVRAALTLPLSELVARMGIGLFSAGAECLAPVTITDIFFVCTLSYLGKLSKADHKFWRRHMSGERTWVSPLCLILT